MLTPRARESVPPSSPASPWTAVRQITTAVLPEGSRFPFHPRLTVRRHGSPFHLTVAARAFAATLHCRLHGTPFHLQRSPHLSGGPVSCMDGPLLPRSAANESPFPFEPSKQGAARLLNCLYGIGVHHWAPHCNYCPLSRLSFDRASAAAVRGVGSTSLPSLAAATLTGGSTPSAIGVLPVRKSK